MGPIGDLMNSGAVLAGFYDYRLVVLSVAISIFASYAALDITERVSAERGWRQVGWLYSGALAMGIGIWAMHYVGMVAFHLPIPVQYDWPTVLLSLLVAVAASWVALFVASQATMGLASTVAGCLFMGTGIAAMHYIGMAAMRLKADCDYSLPLVALSVALAIAISFVALKLVFAGKQTHAFLDKRKIMSALVMGMAIPVMHYVGMAAATFRAEPEFAPDITHAVSISRFGLAGICLVTFLVLLHVCAISTIDRHFAATTAKFVQSQLQLKTVFDNLSEGIEVLDMEGKILEMNRNAVKLAGFVPEEFTATRMDEATDAYTRTGELIPLEERPSNQALEGKFVENFEMGISKKGVKQITTVEISTAPIPGPDGKPVQVIVSYRDITERKRGDEIRARLAAIVESSDVAIIGKDLQGIVNAWNLGAERLFGYKAEEMIGESIRKILPPGAEAEEDEILRRVALGEKITHSEVTRRKKNGEIVWVSVSISPIKDKSGTIIGASKFARDITEQKQLEQQLRHSQKMHALGQLTGGITHDFNNLLGVIAGNLDLLERMVPGNQSAKKRLQVAQRAVSRGADLTRRLLTFSSKEQLNPEVIAVETLIGELVEMARRTLGPEFEIAPFIASPLPPVFVDASGLESAMLNLVLNARDAMTRGGTLAIGAKCVELGTGYPMVQSGDLKPGRHVCISVSDSGCGMPREVMERAFEPFFTTKSEGKGTGLGLAMVYGFVKQSGGAIRLYSELGAGTTASVYLPAANQPSEPKQANNEAPVAEGEGGTVLVVDDELELLDIAEAYLTEMGHRVLLAVNGGDALRLLEQEAEVCLLVTDIFMPGSMSGIELAQEVRARRPGIKVIFTSGFPAESLSERSGKQVDGPLLTKPYLRAEFASIVRRTLGENA